jgi:hypothetical protein
MPMHAETIGVDLQVGLFVLQAAAQRLDANMVQSAPAAVYPDLHASGFQPVCNRCTGELRALVKSRSSARRIPIVYSSA